MGEHHALQEEKGKALACKPQSQVVFHYPEEITVFGREFVDAQQAGHVQTCIVGNEMGERIDVSRKAILQRCDNELRPYQRRLEEGMQHFHGWYRMRMDTVAV